MSLPPIQRQAVGLRSRLMLSDSNGRIVCRRPGVWSALYDCCQECKLTEKPHIARGLCERCYGRFVYKNNPGFAERSRQRQKRYRIRTGYQERYEERRKNDPKLIEQKARAKQKYRDKNSPWPRGSAVRYQIIPGVWIEGTIIDKTKSRAYVQFKATAEWIKFGDLRRVQQ
jgi:hypothetical protein